MTATKAGQATLRLKKLEIFGFKSFADKIEIHFDEGITAIVGPNGSGKSNIGDAVRWVLGEQNARVLRGARMEDIIFNGTAKRKALSFCEVNLTIDNGEGLLPIAYSEVTITRRVFRSGESEYYINRQSCRLKDVVDLFRDTGVGKEGYSIVGQDQIINIINSKPEDRRGAFHESAGIMKFRVRKEEAERRLENTRSNMQRVNDIAAEVGNQLEPMREQSETAREYLALSEELKDLDVNQYLLQYDRSKLRLENMNEQNERAGEKTKGLADAIEASEGELRLTSTASDELDDRSNAIRDEITELAAEEQRREGERNLAVERISNLRREAQRLQGEAEEADGRKAALAADAGRIESAIGIQDGETAESKQGLEELDTRLAAMGEELKRDEEQAGERQSAVMARLNKIGDIKSSLGRLNAMEDGARKRLKQLEDSAVSLDREIALVRDAAGEIDGNIARLNEDASAKRKDFDAAGMRARELATAKKDIDDNMMKARERLQATSTRINMLSAMKRDYEGYAEAVKRLLTDCRNSADLKGRVEGVIGEMIEVPQLLVRAVEMALGPAMQNIVTPSEDDAKLLIMHLRSNNYGRATFLPVSAIRGRVANGQELNVLKMKGCVGLASELVKYDPRYKEIVQSLLGRTVIADDMDSAIAMARACGHSLRFATLQGDIINPGGSMTGGSVNSRFTSLLGRSAELEELTQVKSRNEADIKDFIKQSEQASVKGVEAAEELEKISKDVHDIELAMAREKERRDKAAQAGERVTSSQEALEGERQQLCDTLADIAKEKAEIESMQGGEEKSNADERSEIIRIQQQINEQRERYSELQEQANEMKITLATGEKHRATLESELNRVRREIERTEVQTAAARQLLARQQEAASREEQALSANSQGRQDKTTEKAEAEARLQTIEEERATLRLKRNDLEQKIAADRRALDELKDQQYKLESQRGRIEADLENLQNRIWDTYELTYATAQKLKRADFETAGAAKRITELRERIRAMGTVNVNAIEEYISLKSRYEDYQKQTADLFKAETDLVGIIAELAEKMEKRFREQFKLLNGYFSETFVEMFGGGAAQLVLKDEDDLLNSGIEIVAQPPGKQLQMLSLLSGGEKALTAISLLFAMLKLNPSPFCLLDEIEAALDDVNVKRFANYLNGYTSKTQFVVVTHRKGTMEASNAIYGVTMEEKGISRLVSMKMADYVLVSSQ
jgi:chromosome segregation protein